MILFGFQAAAQDRKIKKEEATLDIGTKGTLVLLCSFCAKLGQFELISRYGETSSVISFESDPNTESFFPYSLQLDADRTYDWKYYDKNIG